MIDFDASTVVSAALKADSVPERALLRAEEADVFALSNAVDNEITEVLGRAKFARILSRERRGAILNILRREAVWFEPALRITECRDPKDDKYLELALAGCGKRHPSRRCKPGAEDNFMGNSVLALICRKAIVSGSFPANVMAL